jgi:hypothetical protein
MLYGECVLIFPSFFDRLYAIVSMHFVSYVSCFILRSLWKICVCSYYTLSEWASLTNLISSRHDVCGGLVGGLG